MKLLKRLARTSAPELRFRSSEAAKTALEAATVRIGRHGWRRTDLLARLAPASAWPAETVSALRDRDWLTANARLTLHFRERTPRFLLDPAAYRRIAASIRSEYPSAREAATARAHEIVNGRFDLLGYRAVSFGPPAAPDWHLDPVHGRRAPLRFWKQVPYLDPACGDHKIIWELNRHQHFLGLGRAAWLTEDPRYADLFVRQLESWIAANPPLVGINWASMLELAFRSISWVWALHFFAADLPGREDREPWVVDLLLGLDRQLEHVASHLSLYFSPNTHLLGEALALYVVGTAVPELRGAQRWRDLGRRVLLHETTAQVHPDGGHAELSAHYHRYALDFYLLALAIARINADDEVERALRPVCERMAIFCRALADEGGHLPMIGDDDGGLLFPICGRDPADASDTLALAASLLNRPDLAVGDPPEEVLWMLGGDRSALARPGTETGNPPSRYFEHSGYVVLRCGRDHLVMDAGPHGFLNGGHAHADALSVVLSVDGVPLLIDPGTATYTMDAGARDRFRSSAMHNTLLLDGRSQSEPDGPFHWKARANARVDVWRAASAFDFAEAEHDGYSPLRHRRAVLGLRDGLWLIVDHVLGGGAHRLETHWHLHAAWRASGHDPSTAELAGPGGLWAGVASTSPVGEEIRGDANGLGWYSPAYGRLEPSSVLRFTSDATLPATIVTAIATGAPRPLHIEALPVSAETEDGWHRAAVAVTDGTTRCLAMFATPLPGTAADGPRAPYRAISVDGTFSTDARVAVLRLSGDGTPLTLSLVDGQAGRWTGTVPVTFRLPSAAADLHLDIAAQRRLSRAGESQRLG